MPAKERRKIHFSKPGANVNRAFAKCASAIVSTENFLFVNPPAKSQNRWMFNHFLALLFPEATVKISKTGEVKVSGCLAPYAARISPFLQESGLRGVTIRYQSRRFYFPSSVHPMMQ